MSIQEIGYSDYFHNIDNRNMYVGQDYLDYIEGQQVAQEIIESEIS